LRLARSREASVPASAHKKIIFTGFGCAGVIVALIVIGLVLAPHSEFDQPGDPPLYAPEQAAAARDSLEALRLAFAAPRSGAVVQTGAGFWKVALTAIRADRWQAGVRALPYGDTFPPGTGQREEWMAAARWSAVSVVLGQAAAHAQQCDTVSQSFRTDANLILSLTRALHARARVALESPAQPLVAAAAERAALSVGRGLETEPDLEHVLLGARVTVPYRSPCAGKRFGRSRTAGCSTAGSRCTGSAGNGRAVLRPWRRSISPLPSRPQCARDRRSGDSAWRNALPDPSNTA
jgi:hypothetical protein